MALFNNFRRGMDKGIVEDGEAACLFIIIVFYLELFMTLFTSGLLLDVKKTYLF